MKSTVVKRYFYCTLPNPNFWLRLCWFAVDFVGFDTFLDRNSECDVIRLSLTEEGKSDNYNRR